MKEIIYYQCSNKRIPFIEWYESLDKSMRLIIDKRISKMKEACMVIIKDCRKNYMNLDFPTV